MSTTSPATRPLPSGSLHPAALLFQRVALDAAQLCSKSSFTSGSRFNLPEEASASDLRPPQNKPEQKGAKETRNRTEQGSKTMMGIKITVTVSRTDTDVRHFLLETDLKKTGKVPENPSSL